MASNSFKNNTTWNTTSHWFEHIITIGCDPRSCSPFFCDFFVDSDDDRMTTITARETVRVKNGTWLLLLRNDVRKSRLGLATKSGRRPSNSRRYILNKSSA